MKSVLITVLLMSAQAFAGSAVPADYSMDCWDHSFFYNRLNVKSGGSDVRFLLSGALLEVQQKLVEVPDGDKRFSNLTISVSVPLEKCRVSNADAKLIRCDDEKLKVHLKANNATNPNGIDQVVEVEHASIVTRKITEQGSEDRTTTGYEVRIVDNWDNVLVHLSLFLGNGIDNTRNCTLK